MQSGSELVRTGIRVRYQTDAVKMSAVICHWIHCQAVPSWIYSRLVFPFVQIQYFVLTGSVDHGTIVTALLDS